MPFNLKAEQKVKIWNDIYLALYAAETETEDALADHSKIVMLEPTSEGLRPRTGARARGRGKVQETPANEFRSRGNLE